MVFAGSLIFLVAAIFFVAGLILLWQGWRGLPEFSEPYCRKCGYDVRGLNWVEPARKCPECGSDLAAAGAVRFGKYRRRPRRMALGACVLGLVLFLPFGLRMAVMLLNRPPAAQSTPSLLATLATNGDDAFTWQELTRRYNSGRLSRGQGATAVNHLIAWLNANPSRRRRPLAWSGDLVKTAIADGVVSGEELARLSDAFYGPAPEVKVRQRLRQGKKLKFEIEGRIAWNLPGLQHLVALRSVSLDGKPVEGKVHKLGRRGIFEHGSVSGGSSALVDSLAPTVKTATVILRPDAEWAEDDLHSRVNEIWGKPIILENVPLERYDLEEAENAK